MIDHYCKGGEKFYEDCPDCHYRSNPHARHAETKEGGT